MSMKPVLLVDDDPGILQVVKAILEMKGVTVYTADNGRACLEELKKGFKGLILLDIMMPEMNGWEVVKTMIETGYTEGNLICMFTAKPSPDPVLAEYAQYVLGYICKPFDAEALVKTVYEYLAFLDR